jgi:DNA-binding transcriptional ArsR family regulator
MRTRHLLSRAQLAAVSHPLRQRMLDLLVEHGELSGRQLLELIPGSPSNPYYHLRVLLKAGLVEVARSVGRRGATEKYYAPVASTYSLDPRELLGTVGSSGRAVRAGILAVAREGAESALDELAEALAGGATGGGGEDPFITMCTVKLPQARAATLRASLKAWLEEAMAEDAVGTGRGDAEEGPCAEYVFYQLFFPSSGGQAASAPE